MDVQEHCAEQQATRPIYMPRVSAPYSQLPASKTHLSFTLQLLLLSSLLFHPAAAAALLTFVSPCSCCCSPHFCFTLQLLPLSPHSALQHQLLPRACSPTAAASTTLSSSSIRAAFQVASENFFRRSFTWFQQQQSTQAAQMAQCPSVYRQPGRSCASWCPNNDACLIIQHKSPNH
jgi:hypothetical protein